MSWVGAAGVWVGRGGAGGGGASGGERFERIPAIISERWQRSEEGGVWVGGDLFLSLR